MANRRRSPRWAQIALVAGLVLAVLAGGTAVGARLLVDRWDRAVNKDELLAPEARDQGGSERAETPEPTGPATPGEPSETEPTGPATPGEPSETEPTGPATPTDPTESQDDRPGAAVEGRRNAVKGPLTYLVIGTDQRASGGGRADAIIIVHVPAGLREAYLISVPRDLLVPIRGHWDDKINAAYALGGGGSGGAKLLSRTLSDLTGIGFTGAAILDFGGFRKVVDALDGVELCLDREVRSIHTGHVFPAGCQQLTGAQALDLARQRYDLPGGDLDRGRHHQRLIRAMVDKVADTGMLTDPLRLDRTIRAIGDALTVDTGGVPLPELAFALRHLRPDRVTGITLPSYPQMIDGTSYVLADPAADGLYQAVRDSQLAAWAAAHPDWRNE